MRFLRIGDILVLTDKGERVSEEQGIAMDFTDCGGNLAVINGEKLIGIENGTCQMNALEDGNHVVELYDKSESGMKLVSSGGFSLIGGVVCAARELPELDIQRLWRAIAYIAQRLDSDESELDKLINGYITE